MTTSHRCRSHLEGQPALNTAVEVLRDGSVEVGENLHSQLRLDAALIDEFVNRIDQRLADAVRDSLTRCEQHAQRHKDLPAPSVEFIILLLGGRRHLDKRLCRAGVPLSLAVGAEESGRGTRRWSVVGVGGQEQAVVRKWICGGGTVIGCG